MATRPSKSAKHPASPHIDVQRGSVHPKPVKDFRPKSPLKIPKANDEHHYGQLTDQSSYSEYAWAFVRRNRFYQAMVDRVRPAFDLEAWGYRGTADMPSGYGLLKAKHYREPFNEGMPVQWEAIDGFARQLALLRPAASAHPTPIDFPRSQVAIVFDLAPLLGPGGTAIDIQIDLARTRLHELADRLAQRAAARKNAPSKPLLRAQLRIADLLSAPTEPTVAQERRRPGALATPRREVPVTRRDRERLFANMDGISLKDVALLIPEFDLGRHGSERLSERQQTARASELAIGARKAIYEWHCLTWLQFD
jgi:hypothetical protein